MAMNLSHIPGRLITNAPSFTKMKPYLATGGIFTATAITGVYSAIAASYVTGTGIWIASISGVSVAVASAAALILSSLAVTALLVAGYGFTTWSAQFLPSVKNPFRRSAAAPSSEEGALLNPRTIDELTLISAAGLDDAARAVVEDANAATDVVFQDTARRASFVQSSVTTTLTHLQAGVKVAQDQACQIRLHVADVEANTLNTKTSRVAAAESAQAAQTSAQAAETSAQAADRTVVELQAALSEARQMLDQLKAQHQDAADARVAPAPAPAADADADAAAAVDGNESGPSPIKKGSNRASALGVFASPNKKAGRVAATRAEEASTPEKSLSMEVLS